jgi:ABC-type branched-subunit amino acid transport system substrate-binding protein
MTASHEQKRDLSDYRQGRREGFPMMKKLAALTCVLSMALSGMAMADTITIGVFEPASGDNGAGGKQEVLGMQYANEVQPKVEINGTEYDVVLNIVDNESSTDKATSAATAAAEGARREGDVDKRARNARRGGSCSRGACRGKGL